VVEAVRVEAIGGLILVVVHPIRTVLLPGGWSVHRMGAAVSVLDAVGVPAIHEFVAIVVLRVVAVLQYMKP
jgi:hypothetical protein